MPRVANNIRPTPEEIQFHCLTQGSIGRGTCDLYLHQGHNRFIGRWKFDSVIPYSIDYKSFSTKGRSKRDANYALKSLQTALGVWNSFNIGVQFKFVKPNASPIVFKLKYKHEPEDGDTDLKVFAESFFPARAMLRRRPCKLYIFGVSFERSFRRYMMRTFLHEAAHILGGRHENPAPADRGYPFVLLDSQNDMSVLVTHRHPRTISMHWQDIKSFSDFMSLPEGHKINGVPIRDIVP
ncbi:hypothetical protein F5Y10DRAFT_257811 [Nemania abortiva]|nr:hypothetical protein F5Y10DRAFT_257811 [Nemania abortiva]